jgi:hypothetical protein
MPLTIPLYSVDFSRDFRSQTDFRCHDDFSFLKRCLTANHLLWSRLRVGAQREDPVVEIGVLFVGT